MGQSLLKRGTILVVTGMLAFLVSCGQDEPQAGVMTVTGRIDPGEMGVALTHEHLLVDFIGADSTGYHRWNRDSVVAVMAPYLEALKQHGVKTFMECTPAYLGRDPVLMKRLSEETGIRILTNTGYYGARDNKFIPEEKLSMEPEELASLWIDEFRNGIEGTGIRPGFIKIAVDRGDSLSEEHRLLVKAAALAHRETGLVIASHTGPDAPALAQLDILAEQGVSPSAFIWVHAQNGTLEGIREAAGRGAWISLDNVNAARDKNPGSRFSSSWYADRLVAMKEAGLLDRVLISHDAGWYRPEEPGGGEIRGYTDLFTALKPVLEERGITEAELRQLLEVNPARAFEIRQH